MEENNRIGLENSMEPVTKRDLILFRISLLEDLRNIILSENNNDNPHEDFGWLRSKSIRKKLNISAGTLQNLRITNKIRYKKLLGSYYYNYDDLKELFNGNTK